MNDDSDKTFEVIESSISGAKHGGERALPPLKKKKDGFSRQDVINSFARAFEMIGGTQRMALWANANPDKFYPLYAKLLPSTSVSIGIGDRPRLIHAIPPTALDSHPGEVIEVEVQDDEEQTALVDSGRGDDRGDVLVSGGEGD